MFTVGGDTFTAAATGAVIGGTLTLSPNGPGITLSGTPVSLGPNGLMIGSTTVPLVEPSGGWEAL